MRRDLAAVYRTGRRRGRDETWSVPCRTDDRLSDLVVRSAPVTEKPAPKRRRAKRPAPRRKVR